MINQLFSNNVYLPLHLNTLSILSWNFKFASLGMFPKKRKKGTPALIMLASKKKVKGLKKNNITAFLSPSKTRSYMAKIKISNFSRFKEV